MRIRMSYLFLGTILLGPPLVALFAAPVEEHHDAPLELRIANFRGLIGVGEHYNQHQLYAIVTNVSKEPVRIWDQWNSWGYHNLTLTLELEDGNQKQLRRFGGDAWTQNGADAVELGPGEHYVFAVWLMPEDRKNRTNSWGPIRVRNGDYPWATLTAHYEIQRDEFTKKKGVWVGRISSKPTRLRLMDETGELGDTVP